ncbi:MAG: hypothetical protein QW238_07340 [Candidatus Bathyarchaeia archaeon]
MMATMDEPKSIGEGRVRVFVTDCEGPVTLNDNAYELSSHFIPKGGELFERISRYDDVLADVVKRPGYKAGDTLKLILPFLKAYGAGDKDLAEYSRSNVLLIPGAVETLRYVMDIMPCYLISTSYRHYVEAVCEALGLPIGNAYSTQVSLDQYEIEGEEEEIKGLCREILEMPVLDPSPEALMDPSKGFKPVLERLDEIFWRKLYSMKCGRMLSDVNPIGGEGKAEALRDVVSRNHCTLTDAIYIGDSITDAAPMRLVREAGGASVSFNGNEYALREAEIAVIAGTATPTAILAHLFRHGGRGLILEAAYDWRPERLQEFNLPSSLINALNSYRSGIPLEVSIVTEENLMNLIERSKHARKALRGEVVGSLG